MSRIYTPKCEVGSGNKFTLTNLPQLFNPHEHIFGMNKQYTHVCVHEQYTHVCVHEQYTHLCILQQYNSSNNKMFDKKNYNFY